MSSCSSAPSTVNGDHNYQNVRASTSNSNESSECPSEHQNEDENDEEEEDLDFNPCLMDSPSLEASSSLSSEIEGLNVDVADSRGNRNAALVTNIPSGGPDHKLDEEIVMQTTNSSVAEFRTGVEKTSLTRINGRKLDMNVQPEAETFCQKMDGTSSRADAVKEIMVGEPCAVAPPRKPLIHLDNEDAICRRTRARYSLASFTLDELETFLQETDDDDELQNVDDEEEYRKFLAAVLQGGDGDQQSAREIEDANDEDEDNDADFELELEEALESDLDDNVREENEEVHVAVGRRPNTRQHRCQKDTGQHKRRLLGHLNRPLRPLLPNTQVATISTLDGKCFMRETAQQFLPSATNDGLNIGFTPHQIGQLHCLIHEHVQLLVQVFSLCVSEPARQHIASDICGLIKEMLHKRDQVLGWKRVPHPIFCFFPPFIHPSVPNKLSSIIPAQCTGTTSSTDHVQKDRSSLDNVVPPSGIVSPFKGSNEYFSNGKVGHCEVTECFSWAPYISGPVLSVLDVAPLLLVGSYINDVSSAVREYQRRHVGISCDNRFEKEPLFPLPGFRSFAEANDQVLRENVPPASNTMPSPPAKDQIFRKTMAAALVEKAKKQIVAPVPKEIAKLAQRFLPLFNPALYPHKPPPMSLANRVLFTDAEDELLALGLMEYNTDWKAIQQRFLPCKSKHQIFVRQKNRSSSKAPENPIKAVRRMKASPLTSEEKARILHGLKVCKLDWMSIWKFIVPYRDPSLLPRQWRVATGTQKSYKLHDEEKKARRRLYESSRRNFKSTSLTNCNALSEKEENSADDGGGNSNGDDCINKEDEAYVHEAFLADWRPGTSSTSAEVPGIDLGRKSSPTYVMSHETSRVQGQMNNNASVGTKSHTNPEFPAFVRSQCLQPHQARRAKNPHLVKLAPDLPPVNLPPSVRVLPQSAFKSFQGGASSKVPGSDGIGGPQTEHGVPQPFHAANLGSIDSVKTRQSGKNAPKQSTDDQRLQYSGDCGNKRGAREHRKPDLKMHPLLFQASESSRLPYNPLNCSMGPFCFFPGNQPQLDLSLFHNSRQPNHGINLLSKPLKSKEVSLSSSGIDFHPLLQRTDNAGSAAATADLAVQHSSNLESSRCLGVQLQKSDLNNSACATCSKPFSPNVKTSELDLEIHLSVASSRKKAVGNIDLTESDRTSYGKTCDPQHRETSSKLHSDHLPSTSVPDGDRDKLDSGAHSSVSSNDKTNINNLNTVDDQSLPEIVMEQEELSDSEEESEEHVEFECEEMADSEGEEESGTEHCTNLLDKENLKVVREKVANKLDSDNKQGQRSTQHDLEGSICGPSEGCTTELEFTDKGKEDLISSSCLNLNSVASVPPPENAERAVMRSARVPDGKDKPLPSSNRPCKITPISKHVNVHKHDGGAIKESNMTPVAVPPARKRRKRACQTDLRVDSPKKRDSSSITVTKDGSKHVNYDEIS